MSPKPGILLMVSVTELSIRPAMANVCPSRSSTSVSVLRVESAGTLKPLIETALLKSRALTSGATLR